MKSISPVVATILLIVILVAIASTVFLWISGYFQNLLTQTEEQVKAVQDVSLLQISYAHLYQNNEGLVLYCPFDDNNFCNVKGEFKGTIKHFDPTDGTYEYIELPSEWFEGKDYIKIEFIGVKDEDKSFSDVYYNEIFHIASTTNHNYFGIRLKYNLSEGKVYINIWGNIYEFNFLLGDYDKWINKEKNINIIIDFKNKNIQVFVNGKELPLARSKGVLYDKLENVACAVIGADVDNISTCKDIVYIEINDFKGYLKEVRFYDRNGNLIGVVYNYPKFVDGIFGKALELDGVDDYIEIPASVVDPIVDPIEKNDKITIVAWIYPKRWYNGWFHVLDKYESSGNFGWHFAVGGNGTYLHFHTGSSYINCNLRVSLNKWQFVAVSYDRSKGKIVFYVGNETGLYKCEKSFSRDIRDTLGEPLYIGYSPSGYEEYDIGIHDDIFVYSRALSDDEIKNFYYRLHLVVYNYGSYPVNLNNTSLVINGCTIPLIFKQTFITESGKPYILPDKQEVVKVVPRCLKKGDNQICLVGKGKVCYNLKI